MRDWAEVKSIITLTPNSSQFQPRLDSATGARSDSGEQYATGNLIDIRILRRVSVDLRNHTCHLQPQLYLCFRKGDRSDPSKKLWRKIHEFCFNRYS